VQRPIRTKLWLPAIFALLSVLLVLLGCDGSKKPQPSLPATAAATQQVKPVAPPAPTPWYQGKWRAQLEVGQLSLEVTADGAVVGELKTARGLSELLGHKDAEADVLRVRLLGPEYFGTAVCERKGEHWLGEMRASNNEPVDLSVTPPRFGALWQVDLERIK